MPGSRTLSLLALLLLAAPWVSAWAAPPEPLALPTSADQPNVYFVRQHAEPLLFPVAVKVDGSKIVTLFQGGYTAVRLAPGKHTFSLAWPFLARQPSTDLDLTIEDGKTYDLFVVGQYQYAGGTGNFYYVRVGSGFVEVAPDEAAKRIQQCCKFKPPA